MQVSFTDDAGNDETLTSAATDVVSAAPASNTPATGAPTISGTAQVGETLTAGTSGIVDADGLTNATFNYQWLADDADIAGATGSTYTLVEADEGQAIKVRVSFTDDAGNEEELTSGATDAVAAPEPPAKPTGLSATPSHDRVVLTWDDPNDDTITGYVILRRNRETDAQGQFTELAPDTGTAATTYTDDTVAAETPYTYRIKAINEHGTSERSRWVHVETTAAPRQPGDVHSNGERDLLRAGVGRPGRGGELHAERDRAVAPTASITPVPGTAESGTLLSPGAVQPGTGYRQQGCRGMPSPRATWCLPVPSLPTATTFSCSTSVGLGPRGSSQDSAGAREVMPTPQTMWASSTPAPARAAGSWVSGCMPARPSTAAREVRI